MGGVLGEHDTIFLTCDEAVDAVCIDLQQYAPQIMLCCNIITLVTDGKATAKKNTQKGGAWISVEGQSNMRWLDGPALGRYVCDLIGEVNPDVNLLATLCARVFQTGVRPGVDPQTGLEGILVETGMETFSCRLCGQCCRSLDYRMEVTALDVARWREQGRNDILKYVAVYKRPGQKETYRIWQMPETGQFVQGCPFLYKIPDKNQVVCRIQETKPAICRQYPLTRKHAVMTGCRGFEKRPPGDKIPGQKAYNPGRLKSTGQ